MLDLPGWTAPHAVRLRVSPFTVFELVGGAAAAILGPGIDPTKQGHLARSVLKLWDGRGRPEAPTLLEEVELVARWARESVHPDAVQLRGEGRRGDGVDKSRDPWKVLNGARWEIWLSLARQHGAARDQATEPEPSRPARAGPSIPPEGQPPWVAPGQPPPRKGPIADPAGLWRKVLDQVRPSSPGERDAAEIFLRPLQVLGVEEGVLVLRAPSEGCASWIAVHLQEDLVRLAEAAGLPIGLVRP